MFDLRKMLMVGSLMPLLTDDRRVVISEHAPAGMQPLWRMPATYPRSARPAGTRAHKRWRVRRSAGRA
jgi:hypothetical protein